MDADAGELGAFLENYTQCLVFYSIFLINRNLSRPSAAFATDFFFYIARSKNQFQIVSDVFRSRFDISSFCSKYQSI